MLLIIERFLHAFMSMEFETVIVEIELILSSSDITDLNVVFVKFAAIISGNPYRPSDGYF